MFKAVSVLNSRDIYIKDKFINWCYYKLLYEEDCKDEGKFRIVPKVTINHVQPTNTMKTRVSLATQIFSKSVADGLKFYQMKDKRFAECQGTIEFTLQMNNMFDALNRRFPKEGVTLINNDFQVLQESLAWLNEWENELLNGAITREQFLTDSTAEGLRVTLMSTISLITDLIVKFGFKYVLTGKITQDCLERFFGILRQAGCQNNHPIFPTLLQLYRLLSIYKIVKPPQFGNCSIDNDISKPFITKEEFHTIFNSKNETYIKEHLQFLKNKLDGLIETSEWECDDIIEEDYEMASVVDCIIYYVSGFITKKMLKHTRCDTCRASFMQHSSSMPEAELVNLNSWKIKTS